MCRPHVSQIRKNVGIPTIWKHRAAFSGRYRRRRSYHTCELPDIGLEAGWYGAMCGGSVGQVALLAAGCDERRSAFHSLKPVSGTSFLGQNGKTGKTPFRHHAQVRSDATREKQDMTNAGRFLERSRFEGILEHAFAFSVMTKLFNISFSSRRSSRRLNEAFEKMTWHLNS